jgi:hypothetical protein
MEYLTVTHIRSVARIFLNKKRRGKATSIFFENFIKRKDEKS